MFAAYLTVTVITILAIVYATIADLAPAAFVITTMREVGMPRSWLRLLALPKAAAAFRLLIGLVAARPLGIAAAVGLVLFFTGAIVAHVHARVLHNIAVPGAFFGLAAASAGLAVAVG